MAKLFRQAAKTKYFPRLKKLLRNVAESDPVMTVPGKSTQERNFVFELELGCLCACSDMAVESHDEPDFVATKEKAKWNFACKMIYSVNSNTVGDNIEKGITQILRFPSDYGMVVVGLSNRMPEERFLPLLDKENDIWGAFASVESATSRLRDELNAFLGQVRPQATTRFKADEDPRFRGILVISHTACGIRGILAPLTAVALIHRMDILDGKSIIGPEKELAERLNKVAQNAFFA
ncbi:MAG: hypothetical protein KA191_16070 [Verrucomicrobia bacterium]|nr:hypothetical protein [Verrucomicrobiota bacterium]